MTETDRRLSGLRVTKRKGDIREGQNRHNRYKDSSSTRTLTVSPLHYYILINLTFNFLSTFNPKELQEPFLNIFTIIIIK